MQALGLARPGMLGTPCQSCLAERTHAFPRVSLPGRAVGNGRCGPHLARPPTPSSRTATPSNWRISPTGSTALMRRNSTRPASTTTPIPGPAASTPVTSWQSWSAAMWCAARIAAPTGHQEAASRRLHCRGRDHEPEPDFDRFGFCNESRRGQGRFCRRRGQSQRRSQRDLERPALVAPQDFRARQEGTARCSAAPAPPTRTAKSAAFYSPNSSRCHPVAPSRPNSRCAPGSPAMSASIICRVAAVIRRRPNPTAGSAPKTTPRPRGLGGRIIAGRGSKQTVARIERSEIRGSAIRE